MLLSLSKKKNMSDKIKVSVFDEDFVKKHVVDKICNHCCSMNDIESLLASDLKDKVLTGTKSLILGTDLFMNIEVSDDFIDEMVCAIKIKCIERTKAIHLREIEARERKEKYEAEVKAHEEVRKELLSRLNDLGGFTEEECHKIVDVVDTFSLIQKPWR